MDHDSAENFTHEAPNIGDHDTDMNEEAPSSQFNTYNHQHQNRVFPDEIPDSQEAAEDHTSSGYESDVDSDIYEFPLPPKNSDTKVGQKSDEKKETDNNAAFVSVDTESVSKRSHIPQVNFPLHGGGINCNGRVASEAPQHKDVDMEEVATQAATQPHDDVRRAGRSGSLSTQEEADIIAILHPTSPAAHVAISLTGEACPQHILQNQDKLFVAPTDGADIGDSPSNKEHLQDIALRFSSRVNDIRLGFVFGRNIHHSDILLVRDERMEARARTQKQQHAVSNKHFRIFLNRFGILMLEDTSTNGTIVDNHVLRGPKALDQTHNPQPRMTLHMGNVIEIPTTGNGESIRFIVTVPQHYHDGQKYDENLRAYIACVDQAERKAAAIAQAEAERKIPPERPGLTNALPAALQQHVTPTTSSIFPGVSGGNYGLFWNGGEKYNVVGYVGAGAFATVCKLSSKRDGEVFAVKQLEKRRFLKDGIANNKFYNELNVMMNARHPNIVEYRDHHETETHLFIVMEFVPHGDLRHWTGSHKKMTEYMAARIGKQMLDAMMYLHNQGITHRDIKPDNILIAGDDPQDKIFKLSDFGLSKQVINDQTFLQTFCGTLLYLAPEVYPGYEEAKIGRTPRPRRTRGVAADLPYEHSVDIWSLGVVLFQVLAGTAPFDAKSDNKGERFLNTLMNEPIDFELLKYEGIEPEGIDFISKMLVVDPKGRARETDLMGHPWLIPKPHPGPKNARTAEEANIPDASQLSLTDNLEDDGEVADSRATKRFRSNKWTTEGDYDIREAGDDEMFSEGLPYSEASNAGLELRLDRGPPPPRTQSQLYPTRPQTELPYSEAGNTGLELRLDRGPPPPRTQSQLYPTRPQTERLFGEIGSSALRSSGVLGQNAHAALEVSMVEGSGEEDIYRTSFQEQGRSNSGSATHANTPQSDATERITPGNIQARQTTDDHQYFSADPSLLGAEALVGQLNMDSLEFEGSAPSGDNKLTSPKTHSIQKISTTSSEVKRPSPDSEPIVDKSNKKPSKTTNQPRSGNYISNYPTKKRSSASKASTKISTKDVMSAQDASTAGATTKQPSQESNSEHQDGQQSQARGKTVSLPETAGNSQESISKSSMSSNGSKEVATARGKMSPPMSINPSMDLAPPSGSTHDGFVKPSMRFGNLRLVQGSIPSVGQIKITSMGTSYGRDPSSKYVHPNSLDTRVPKNAFDISMWYPGMGKDLRAGKANWAVNPNLVAVISTRTRIRIAVNGISLKKGENCWLFGRLKTGDVISAIELPEGQLPKNDYEREYIRYQCEFFIGASKGLRKDNEPFTVEQEDDKYQKYFASKIREGSVPVQSMTASNTTAGASVSAPPPPSTMVETSTTTTTVPTNNPLGKS